MPVSAAGFKTKAFAYEEFMGLDVSRDRYALDTGEKQHLSIVQDGYCDRRGSIIRDHGLYKRGPENQPIEHVAFYGRDLVVYARRDGGGISLCTETGVIAEEVFPRNAVISSTVFNGSVVFVSNDCPMQLFDGISFKPNKTNHEPRAKYVASIQHRLAIAGMPDKPTEIWFSRADDENVMPQDEPAGSADALRAALLDVRNVLGTSDSIRGLGVFETNRLAIFAQDQVIVYAIDPNYERWALDDRANVRVGTLSHRTIAQAGSDLLFCSRSGVHSLKRSDANGTTIYSIPLSTKVEDLYRSMVNSVENPEQISAVFDQDNQQYHIFFPQPGGVLSYRLTMTLNPLEGGEHKWSTGVHLNARCGATLGGITLFGTSGGIYQVAPKYVYSDAVLRKKLGIIQPDFVVETPVLWHGSITENKDTNSFILQATGTGEIEVQAFDEQNRSLWGKTFLLDDSGKSGKFLDVPLPRQYEVPFAFSYRGVWFRFTGRSQGVIKIIGFAVTVRADR